MIKDDLQIRCCPVFRYAVALKKVRRVQNKKAYLLIGYLQGDKLKQIAYQTNIDLTNKNIGVAIFGGEESEKSNLILLPTDKSTFTSTISYGRGANSAFANCTSMLFGAAYFPLILT